MKCLFICLLIFALSTPICAQDLPSNFEYKRETGQETGIPLFQLGPNMAAVVYDAKRGSGFEALGAVVQPEREKYGLVFWNAKEKYQFSLLDKLTATIKIDDQEFAIAEAMNNTKGKIGQLYIETATLVIDKKLFVRLCQADDVTVRVGPVTYNLDEDNINAFRYFLAEITRDLNRRNKKAA